MSRRHQKRFLQSMSHNAMSMPTLVLNAEDPCMKSWQKEPDTPASSPSLKQYRNEDSTVSTVSMSPGSAKGSYCALCSSS